MASMGGTTLVTSQNPLPAGQWTQVSVFFAYSSGRGAASISFGNVLQTPSTETNLFTIVTVSETNTDEFKIGGFKGAFKNLNIFSPGAAQISTSKHFLFFNSLRV